MIVDDTFLDRVAHDLRGELSTMLAGLHYVQRIRADVGTPSRDMLERVNEAGDRMTRLLEEVDDAVWLLDKPKPLLCESLQLRSLMEDLVQRAGKLSSRRGVHLRVETKDAQDRPFVGDAEVLARALLHVADFAMLRAPGPDVRVTAEFVSDSPLVCIEDRGALIPEGVAVRLFEPFVENELVSLHPTGRRKVRLGLGLAIARAMLQAHGGSISMDSQSNGGATGVVFRCVLTGDASTCGTPTNVVG